MNSEYIVRLYKANEGNIVEQLVKNFSSENEARNFINNYNGNYIGQLWVIVEGNNLLDHIKRNEK
ncbi:hypothetical protein [Legionella sp. PC997]|uniref:hypothetical protein n=1 Tax=Legionella sp. PC997 TaxID=2755562 RepID=UPI0015FC699B|nr:hypothetical protein [Legionella sp. PC997]QMT61837.1 hypothetical protein HBNCFIEN_03244 [Legionella sp. PC997]